MNIIGHVHIIVDGAENSRDEKVHDALQGHKEVVQFAQIFNDYDCNKAVQIDHKTHDGENHLKQVSIINMVCRSAIAVVEPKWIFAKDLGRMLQENGNPPTLLSEMGNLAKT